MQIALMNVCHSPNLGDGLLSHCLASELERGRPDVRVVTYDLAGRSSVGEGAGRRKVALSVLSKLPKEARRTVVGALLGREVERRYRPVWKRALSEADVAVLGGGNLISDIDLNFPVKIGGFAAELRAAGKAWAVFGVGVSDNWSRRGRRLFEEAFRNPGPSWVTVRDGRSSVLWNKYLVPQGTPAANVCPDPAVLSCDHFPAAPRPKDVKPVLGFNITDPGEITLHADENQKAEQSLTEWWVALIRLAIEAGYEVRLFTNGLIQDEEYLELLRARFDRTVLDGRGLSVCDRAKDAKELAATVSGCDVLAGHRMHAHIPAYSYRIPSVGFTWDIKLQSFFESVGRGEFMLTPGKVSPAETLETIAKAYSTGVDESSWSLTLSKARNEVSSLVDFLRARTSEGLGK